MHFHGPIRTEIIDSKVFECLVLIWFIPFSSVFFLQYTIPKLARNISFIISTRLQSTVPAEQPPKIPSLTPVTAYISQMFPLTRHFNAFVHYLWCENIRLPHREAKRVRSYFSYGILVFILLTALWASKSIRRDGSKVVVPASCLKELSLTSLAFSIGAANRNEPHCSASLPCFQYPFQFCHS